MTALGRATIDSGDLELPWLIAAAVGHTTMALAEGATMAALCARTHGEHRAAGRLKSVCVHGLRSVTLLPVVVG